MSRRHVLILLKTMATVMFSAAFMWRCANAMAPTGGPRDTLAPVVIAATPAFNTTEFNAKRILISFDEYVQLQNQQNEFFVSPPLGKKPTLTLKGRGVQIDILDNLSENTTYAFDFGNSIKDNNEGNELGSFRYVFSTGKEIDSMYMSGYTVSAENGDSISRPLIFFYYADVDSVPDYDSTLLKLTPAVLARGEDNGVFLAQNLKPVDYRVYVVKDNNNNFTYDPGVDDVAFLDSVLNPLHMPEFKVWFDTTRNYLTAQPQVNFRLFREESLKRQRLNNSLRPSQHQIRLEFGASHPVIEEISIEGIDNDKIITEYVTKGCDTINYWLNVPSQELPDTLKGRLIYYRHDSLMQLVPDTVKLSLFWRYVESESERKAREEEEKKKARAERNGEEYKAPEKPNPFKGQIPSGQVNPENHLTMEFGYPLVNIDTSRLLLIRLEDDDKMFRVRYTLENDSMEVRKWKMSTLWNEGGKYRVMALPGAFTDVEGNKNDSLTSNINVLSAEDFGTFTVNVKGKSDTSRYVLYLLNNNNKILQIKKDVVTGKVSFKFVPVGDVRLKVLEDINGNGEWDTGNIIQRRQPERNEIYYSPEGEDMIAMKANWEVELDVDMADLFKPETTESLRARMAMLEQARRRKLAKQLAEREKNNGRSSNNGGNGFSLSGF